MQPDAFASAMALSTIDLFIQDKRNHGLTNNVIGKYTRELASFRVFCEEKNAYTVQRIAREPLTAYCATWLELCPSSTKSVGYPRRWRLQTVDSSARCEVSGGIACDEQKSFAACA